MIDVLGRAGAESTLLAAVPGRVLWTDDLVMARLARGELGVVRVWTQVALAAVAESGCLSVVEYHRASAKLLGWNYTYTTFSSEVVAAAGEIAAWAPDRWPLRQAIDAFALEAVSPDGLPILVARTVACVFQSAALHERRADVTVRLLERLGNRHGGIDLVRTVERLLPAVFGLNVVRAAEARALIRTWLVQAERSRVMPR